MTRHVLAALATVTLASLAAPVASGPASASLSIPSFKMVTLGGGGAVPSPGPVIRVAFDGIRRQYTDVDAKPLELPAIVKAGCGGELLTALTLEVAGHSLPVSTAGMGKGGGTLSGRTTVSSSTVSTRVLDTAAVPGPVATCNADLAALVEGGQYGKAQKGWARRYDRALVATLKVKCTEKNPSKKGAFPPPPAIYTAEDSVSYPVWVHCGPAAVFDSRTSGSQPRARRSSDVERDQPQRVRSVPQRVAGDPPDPAEPTSPPAAAPRSPLPDLVVADARLAPTAPTKLRVQIANRGTRASAPTTVTLFYQLRADVQETRADVGPIQPDGSLWIIIDAGAALSAADHLTLRVDHPAGLAELDESNNAFTVR